MQNFLCYNGSGSCCRYVQNGFDISTQPPNVGKAVQLKQLIMQSATRVTGACLARLLASNYLPPTSPSKVTHFCVCRPPD